MTSNTSVAWHLLSRVMVDRMLHSVYCHGLRDIITLEKEQVNEEKMQSDYVEPTCRFK